MTNPDEQPRDPLTEIVKLRREFRALRKETAKVLLLLGIGYGLCIGAAFLYVLIRIVS
jgi:hypothetical protein